MSTTVRRYKSRTDELAEYVSKVAVQCDLDAEKCVIGCMMLDNECAGVVTDLLDVEDFFSARHKLIYAAMVDMVTWGRDLDPATLKSRLVDTEELEEAGGMSYLVICLDRVFTAVNVMTYAQAVKDKANERNFQTTLRTALAQSNSLTEPDDLQRIKDDLVKRINSVIVEAPKSPERIGQIAKIIDQKMEDRALGKSSGYGVNTNITAIDDALGGLQGPNIITIAGETGGGKTSLALQMATGIARQNKHVVFFTQEMSAEEMTERAICQYALLEHWQINRGLLSAAEKDRKDKLKEFIDLMPLDFDERPNMTPSAMMAKCRYWHHKQPLKAVFVDYWQIMRASKNYEGNEAYALGEIGAGLKEIAKEFNVPVVVLAQFSRESDKNKGKRRQLSDLRGSAAIEQWSDIVMFIYDEVWGMSPTEREKYPADQKRVVQLSMEKSRNGNRGTIRLGFTPAYTKFGEWSKSDDAGLF